MSMYTLVVDVSNNCCVSKEVIDITKGSLESHQVLVKFTQDTGFYHIAKGSTSEVLVHDLFGNEYEVPSSISNSHRGYVLIDITDEVIKDHGKYICSVSLYNSNLTKELSAKFIINVPKCDSESSDCSCTDNTEVIITRGFYNELYSHLRDNLKHLTDKDTKLLDFVSDNLHTIITYDNLSEAIKNDPEIVATIKQVAGVEQIIEVLSKNEEVRAVLSSIISDETYKNIVKYLMTDEDIANIIYDKVCTEVVRLLTDESSPVVSLITSLVNSKTSDEVERLITEDESVRELINNAVVTQTSTEVKRLLAEDTGVQELIKQTVKSEVDDIISKDLGAKIDSIYKGSSELPNVLYYKDLSTAVNDLNEDNTSNSISVLDNPGVKVFTSDTGRLTIMLLDDLSESSTVKISKDVDLILAGHTINFTTYKSYLLFGIGTSCTINGEVSGSSIIKNIPTYVPYDSYHCSLVITQGDSLIIKGGNYLTTYNSDNYAICVGSYSNDTKVLEMYDCYVECINLLDNYTTNRGHLRCINSFSKKSLLNNVKLYATSITNIHGVANFSQDLYVKNCDINIVLKPNCGMDLNSTTQSVAHKDENGNYDKTGTSACGITCSSQSSINLNLYVEDSLLVIDAPGCDAYTESSSGISTYKFTTCYVKNTEIYATHTGIGSYSSSLYVRDSVLSGMSHGGLYVTTYDYETAKRLGFTGTLEEWEEYISGVLLYVKDTVLRNNYYRGIYKKEVVAAHGGIGNNCYIGNYYDKLGYGRDVHMDGCTFLGLGPCVRYAKNSPNRLFVSNTTIPDGFSVRVMSSSSSPFTGLMKIGVNCNFTPDRVSTADGSPDNAEVTNEIYRKYYDGEEFTSTDHEAFSREVISVPKSTEVDEGKFLRLVNGVPTWTTIVNAEEVTF